MFVTCAEVSVVCILEVRNINEVFDFIGSDVGARPFFLRVLVVHGLDHQQTQRLPQNLHPHLQKLFNKLRELFGDDCPLQAKFAKVGE